MLGAWRGARQSEALSFLSGVSLVRSRDKEMLPSEDNDACKIKLLALADAIYR